MGAGFSLRRFILVSGLLIALPAGWTFAQNAEVELRFASGLHELGYHDLAAEQLTKLDWRAQKDEDLRNRIFEELAASFGSAATSTPRREEALKYARLTTQEFDAFLKLDLDESYRNNLLMKAGEAQLDRGRRAFDLLQRAPQAPDAAQVAEEGVAAFQAAMAAFGKASEGYGAVAKRVEAKTNVNDSDRRLREQMRQKEVVATMQVAWSQYHLSQLLREQKKVAEATALLRAAMASFDKISANHMETVAGVSAALGKGMCQQALGQNKEAITTFDQVMQVLPTSDVVIMLRTQSQYEKAACQEALGDAAGALATLDNIQDMRKAPRSLQGLIRLRYATLLGRRADAARAENEKAFAQVEALRKKPDPASRQQARQMENKARRDRESYRGDYAQAVDVARELTAVGHPLAQEANALIGKWMSVGGIRVRRTPAELFALGESQLAAGQVADAVESYRQTVAAPAPENPDTQRLRHDAWVQMGKAYARGKDNLYAAGLVFGQTARLHPDSPYAEKLAEYSAMILGNFFKETQSEVAAQAYLEAQALLVDQFPNNEAARRAAFRLGDVCRAREEHVRAARYYRTVPMASEYYERARYLSGWCLWQAALQKRKQEPADTAGAQELAAEADRQLREFMEWTAAQPPAEAAAEQNRRLWAATARLFLAESLLEEPRVQPEETLKLLAEVDPAKLPEKDMPVRVQMARIRAHAAIGTAESLQQAETVLAELVKQHPANPTNATVARFLADGYGRLAQSRNKAGAADAEVKGLHAKVGNLLDKSLQLNPNQTIQDYVAVATSLYQAGLVAQALEAFERIPKKFGAQAEHAEIVWDARAWVGRCSMELERWPEAAAAYGQLVKQFPKVLDYRRSLALALERGAPEDVRRAAEEWARVEETARMGTPEWLEARLHRIKTLAGSDRKPVALQLYAAAAVAYPDLGGAALKPQFEKIVRESFTPEQQDQLAAVMKALNSTADVPETTAGEKPK